MVILVAAVLLNGCGGGATPNCGTTRAVSAPTMPASSATPCMDALDRFTAPGVPAMGPMEIPQPMGKWTNSVTPSNLPGDGLAQHPLLYIGEGYNTIYLVNQGKIIWTYSTGPGNELDDAWMLSNGNILFTRMQYLAEITPEKPSDISFDLSLQLIFESPPDRGMITFSIC
jgi:hypothetical protein